MPTEEAISQAVIVGILSGALTALLIGGLIAIVRHRSAQKERIQHLAADWLAARLSLHCACETFVVSFRALAWQPRDSQLFTLCMMDARQAKQEWVTASYRATQAEARLHVFDISRNNTKRHALLQRVGYSSMQQAVLGDQAGADKFVHMLHTLDDDAREFATIVCIAERTIFGTSFAMMLVGARAHFDTVTDRWGGRRRTNRPRR